MIALQIVSLKNFMNSILAGEAFDIFLVEEASVTGSCTYSIDGHLNKAFYTPEELAGDPACTYDFTRWKDLKGFLYHLIKGKHTPLHFKFVLHLMPEHVPGILTAGSTSPEQIRALVLTVKYEDGQATLFTGTSFHTFLPDKEPDRLWDAALLRYLDKKEIACRVL